MESNDYATYASIGGSAISKQFELSFFFLNIFGNQSLSHKDLYFEYLLVPRLCDRKLCILDNMIV